MKLRLLSYLVAVLLPVAAVLVTAYFTLPGFRSSTVILPTSSTPIDIPETLGEAKKATIGRLLHLQKLSQDQWDQERQTIMYKTPPGRIEDAIARTQQRLKDLNAMNPEDWENEKQRLIRAEELRIKGKI